MIFPTSEWTRSTPGEQGVDADALHDALAYLESESGEDGVRQCVVLRRGYLIHEGPESGKVHDLWSVTKSFTSTLLGLMIDDGLCALNDRAADYEPLLAEHYPDVRLRHFASMTSGYQAKGPTRYPNLKQDWSVDCFDPAPPLFEPGQAFAYWDNAQNMFGRVLTQILQGDLHDYLKERILDPIGVGESRWDSEGTVNGIPIRYGGTHLFLNAYDLARFGHLFLNLGDWNGRQLISPGWVRMATAPQVPSGVPIANTERTDMEGSGCYGFNWWLNGVKGSGQWSLPGAPLRLFFASGLNNNMCFVIPEWEMVFVRAGTDVNPPAGKFPVYTRFFNLLGQGIALNSSELKAGACAGEEP